MSSISSSSTGTASIGGIISGLSTDDIITKMVEYAKTPLTLLQTEQSTYTAKLKAWQGMNTNLLALKTKASALADPTAFETKTTSSSNQNLLTATATTSASSGTYTITVKQLAQVGQQQSQSYSDIDTTTLGTGTLKIGLGDDTQNITVDSTNNTLSGIKDAINKANTGVTASIIDLGSLDTHDYRLVLTGNTTGSENAITWDASGLSGGTTPTWTSTQTAQDSIIVLGSGTTAATINKSSNTISDVISGVTLNLQDADTDSPVTLKVSSDTSAIKQSIDDFVTEYNTVMDAIAKQFTYDSSTQTSGDLFGDFTLQNIQSELRSNLLTPINGLPSTMSTLGQIGFSTDSGDHLVVDDTKLESALESNPDGVMKLFSGSGETSDYTISYLSSTDDTKDTSASGIYQVRIDTVAQQARVTAGAAQTANLASDENLTINGKTVSLTAGMSQSQVAAAINAMTGATGIKASLTQADGTGTGNYLTLTQASYGSKYHLNILSNVSNGGGTPASNTSGLGNVALSETSYSGETATGTGNAGADVAGAFGVTKNGVTTWETATGSGQILTGNSDNENTSGLTILAKSTTTGSHGTVTLTRGLGASMNKLLGYLTGSNGDVANSEKSIQTEIDSLQDDIDSKQEWLTEYEDTIRTEFNDMETAMGSLKSTGDYLTSQFKALVNSSSSSNS